MEEFFQKMIKRILEVSSGGTYLSVKHRQLIIKLQHGDTHTVSCEDIGVLLIDHPSITLTTSVINSVTLEGGCIVVCGINHLPATLMLPIEGNTLQGERFRKQAEISKPFSKKIWSQLVKAKIFQQARLLEKEGKNSEILNRLGKNVRSGDPDNLEAQASRNYWKPLFGSGFKRDRVGKSPNNFLNYGYTVLRSMVARAICGTGLHPTIGVHHHNKYNAYALADDLMEPYRALVDQTVLEFMKKEEVSEEITREAKTSLLGMFNRQLYLEGNKQVVQIAIQITAESLSKSIIENEVKLKLPESLLIEEK